MAEQKGMALKLIAAWPSFKEGVVFEDQSLKFSSTNLLGMVIFSFKELKVWDVY